VLAIGIVVDDAIVVVEGAAHHIEQGMSGHDAAIKAMDELFGPIIGITLVLMAVFLPAAFLPGLTGPALRAVRAGDRRDRADQRDQRRDAEADAMRALAAPPVPPEKRNFFYRGFNAVYDAVERGYAGLIRRMVRHSTSCWWSRSAVGLAGWGISRVPTGFLPIEDQGYC
jgi:HAE1 family hydrophobic/amphiphilic exporter-1